MLIQLSHFFIPVVCTFMDAFYHWNQKKEYKSKHQTFVKINFVLFTTVRNTIAKFHNMQ